MIHTQIHLPPHKIYAFERAWSLTWEVVENIMAWAKANAQGWFERIDTFVADIKHEVEHEKEAVKDSAYILAYTAAVFCFLFFIVAPWVLALLVMVVFVVVHVLMLVILMGLALLLIEILTLSSSLYRRARGIYYRCPRSFCYTEMPVPTFVCPDCRALHSRLRPSVYGIFSHRCQCGKKLRTIDRLGRRDLDRVCPACRAPLDPEIGQSTNVDIPIVGGPSSGKTNYIVTAIRALQQKYESDPYNYTLSFTEPIHKQQFEARIAQLETGDKLTKTPDIAPEAYRLKIKPPRAHIAKLVSIYDAAGEAFNTDANSRLQSYYKYIRGMIFVIDPCAISAYRRNHRDEIESIRSSLGPSELDVEQACNRLILMMEIHHGGAASHTFSVPVAVVVTKVDALGLEDEIGVSAVQRLIGSSPSQQAQEDAINTLVQEFLCKHGLSNFMDQLAMQFSEVRYFSCSALGRLPTDMDKSSFVPMRVLDPMEWLLIHTKVVKRR